MQGVADKLSESFSKENFIFIMVFGLVITIVTLIVVIYHIVQTERSK